MPPADLANVASPATIWDGNTAGTKNVGKRFIGIMSADQRNGGVQGAGDGAAEAAKPLGWDVRSLDGQAAVHGDAILLTQAIAMTPDGILNVGIDLKQQLPVLGRPPPPASRPS